jgi:curved DNA-binding protein CbpA
VNPYEVLGVPKDADTPTIRRAYRRAAKRAHPDAGGSDRQFQKLSRALSVLTSPARRERFDRTGSVDDAVDNTISFAMQLISAALDEVLREIMGKQRKPEQASDLLGLVQRNLSVQQTKAHQEISMIAEGIKINERLLGRFASEGENRLEVLLKGRIAQLRGGQVALENKLASLSEAIKIVAGHTFRSDYEPAKSPADKWMSMLNSGPRMWG